MYQLNRVSRTNAFLAVVEFINLPCFFYKKTLRLLKVKKDS